MAAPKKARIYRWKNKLGETCMGYAYYHKQTEDLIAVGMIVLNKVDPRFRETGENFFRKESECTFVGFKD